VKKKRPSMSEKNVEEKPLRGIVRRAASKEAEAGGDETFAPDYTVTSTTGRRRKGSHRRGGHPHLLGQLLDDYAPTDAIK
jgi:hypothetical protein